MSDGSTPVDRMSALVPGGREILRDELTPERIDQLAAEARAAGFDYFLSREDRDRRFAEALAGWTPGTDAWVFGYGSLMWNPAFHFVETRPVRVEGWRRRFCFWTPLGRGTPDRPGLMLGIERGGACEGLALRIAASEVPVELGILFNREMLTGIYDAVWVDAFDRSGAPVKAVTFAVNGDHQQYCGDMELTCAADNIAFAEGRRGTCRAYLEETARSLRAIEARDPYIDALMDEVARLRAAAGLP